MIKTSNNTIFIRRDQQQKSNVTSRGPALCPDLDLAFLPLSSMTLRVLSAAAASILSHASVATQTSPLARTLGIRRASPSPTHLTSKASRHTATKNAPPHPLRSPPAHNRLPIPYSSGTAWATATTPKASIPSASSPRKSTPAQKSTTSASPTPAATTSAQPSLETSPPNPKKSAPPSPQTQISQTPMESCAQTLWDSARADSSCEGW
jgi:hypothetical protein